MMLRVVDGPIDARTLEAAVAWPGAGAVVTFTGITRDHFEGRPVTRLTYEAYTEMAVAKMAEIRAEIIERWPQVRCAMAHRVGEVGIGEASVVIAVAAPHREAAFEAGRFAIDALKARVPIWKKEHYADGTAWKANAECAPGSGGGEDGR